MRRQITGVVLLGLLGAWACSTPPGAATARLAGPNSLAVAGDRLLVANTGEAQLDVLQLGPGDHSFIRAPNPLFPLAIPTSEFPRSVAAAPGAKAAPFAFALSTVANDIAVVSTAQLALLGRIPVLGGTALAAAVPAPVDGAPQRLAVTTTRDQLGALLLFSFPGSLEANFAAIPQIVPDAGSPLALGRSIPQVIAASPTDPNLLAIGDRLTGDDGEGRTGGLILVDLASGAVARFDVGGPVAALAFDPSGKLLFGVLDTEACGTLVPCLGAFAFNVADRLQLPAPGVPIDVPGVPRGIAAGGPATLTLPSGATTTVDPLVAVSSSDGSVYLVDGAAARVINVSDVPGTFHLAPDGTRVDDPNGPSNIVVGAGVRLEQISVTFEGVLPSLKSRSGTLDAAGSLASTVDFAATGVQVGDLVVFEAPKPDASCPDEAAVTTVASGLLGIGGLPASCAGTATFSVRAAANTYVVSGSVSGLIGRVSANSHFDWVVGGTTRLSFDLGSGDPRRDAQYAITPVTPFAVPLSGLSMPGAVAFDPAQGFFFVAYVGGNSVIELHPADLRSGQSRGLVQFQ